MAETYPHVELRLERFSLAKLPQEKGNLSYPSILRYRFETTTNQDKKRKTSKRVYRTIPRFLSISVLAVAVCLSLGFGVVRADDDGDEQGGDIEGTESLDAEIAMTPTTAALASIEASLQAEDDEGTTNATLTLDIQGLPAGTFCVNVTLKSNGTTVALGCFTLTGGDVEVVFGTQGGGDNQGNDNAQGDENDNGNQTVIPFPANFNPFDIATISVTDSSNVVLFTADLTNLAAVISMNFDASVQAKPGAVDPGATGNAVLTAFVSHGAAKGMLQLNGSGLNPNMASTIMINGAKVKKTITGRSGQISFNLTPKGKGATVARGASLFRVNTISLHDKFGNVLLNANF